MLRVWLLRGVWEAPAAGGRRAAVERSWVAAAAVAARELLRGAARVRGQSLLEPIRSYLRAKQGVHGYAAAKELIYLQWANLIAVFGDVIFHNW